MEDKCSLWFQNDMSLFLLFFQETQLDKKKTYCLIKHFDKNVTKKTELLALQYIAIHESL